MDITWHGYSCFTLKTKNCTVVLDPYSDAVGLKLPALKADIVLISKQEEEHNNVAAIKEPGQVIDWPGEYEVKGVAITAHTLPQTKEKKSTKGGASLYFLLEIDGINICFLGDLQGELSDELIEGIGDVDLLMLPIGGNGTMDAKQAHNVIEEIEPRAILPMHYAVPGVKATLDGVEVFLKQGGVTGIEAKEKFTINSRSELSEDKLNYILLTPQTAT